MRCQALRLVLLVIAALTLVPACQGKRRKADPTKVAANERPTVKAEPGKRAEKVEKVQKTLRPKPAPEEPAKPEAKKDDPLGERFRDPPWYRKEILSSAKFINATRSERDENDLFSSQMLFELPGGSSAKDCIAELRKKVEPHIPKLEETTEDDGRITVRGNTERYRATLVCGEAKGTVRAYVGYQWLN